MRAALGAILIALPFAGLAAFMIRSIGTKETVGVFLGVALTVATVMLGCYLMLG